MESTLVGSPFTGHTHAEDEISSQPSMWNMVADFAPSMLDLLPSKGEKIAVVGCGSSWFMSQCFGWLREESGFGETDIYVGSEMNFARKYDRVLAISRSGTTSEVVRVLNQVDAPSVVLTAVPGSPVTQAATKSIVMDFADEVSVLQTRWVTAALGLLRIQLGLDLRALVPQAEEALASDLGDLVSLEQIAFLGRGWTIGLAHEAALKTRESSQFWAEAYPAMDYRHGPISIAQPGRGVWAFGAIDDDLRKDILHTGALLETSTLDPMAHLIRAQRTAIAIAKSRGLDPDNPRNLSRSIVLD